MASFARSGSAAICQRRRGLRACMLLVSGFRVVLRGCGGDSDGSGGAIVGAAAGADFGGGGGSGRQWGGVALVDDNLEVVPVVI